MKKFIYILIISSFASIAISSCTEEDVKPSTETNNGGGSSSGDKGGF